MRRSTIFLLVIFILLAILVWYTQTSGNIITNALATSTNVASESNGSLIDSAKGPVHQLSIQDSSGKTVTIDKTSTGWNVLNDGIVASADPNLAESAGAQILSIQIIKKLETAPDALGTGLNKPDYTVSVTLADQTVYKFQIGKAVATGVGYYAESLDGKIYILNKSEIDTILKIFTQPPFLQTLTPKVGAAGSETSNGTPIAPSTPTKIP
jgi:hypothetical protein